MMHYIVRGENIRTNQIFLLGITPSRKKADEVVDLHKQMVDETIWEYLIFESDPDERVECILNHHIQLLNDRIAKITREEGKMNLKERQEGESKWEMLLGISFALLGLYFLFTAFG